MATGDDKALLCQHNEIVICSHDKKHCKIDEEKKKPPNTPHIGLIFFF